MYAARPFSSAGMCIDVVDVWDLIHPRNTTEWRDRSQPGLARSKCSGMPVIGMLNSQNADDDTQMPHIHEISISLPSSTAGGRA